MSSTNLKLFLIASIAPLFSPQMNSYPSKGLMCARLKIVPEFMPDGRSYLGGKKHKIKTLGLGWDAAGRGGHESDHPSASKWLSSGTESLVGGIERQVYVYWLQRLPLVPPQMKITLIMSFVMWLITRKKKKTQTAKWTCHGLGTLETPRAFSNGSVWLLHEPLSITGSELHFAVSS